MWERAGYAGDVWTFTAIYADTKLVPTWLIGQRHRVAAVQLITDLESQQ